jgi:hypothetical protein
VSDEPASPLPRPPVSRAVLIAVAAVVVVLTVAIDAAALFLGSAPAAPAAPAPSTHAAPSMAAYRGLGTWVDIFDKRAWSDPATAVVDMASHGVSTLYLQTGNSHSTTAFKDEAGTTTFIREAHARGMRVVAWYLPYFKDEAMDLDRVTQAIRFRTADGQSFDGFALDIESSAVKPESARILALESLSLKIRAAAGPGYPLGAIIPSPVGLARKSGYWDAFPYTSIARTYDVILPMGYYTYHAKGAAAVAADAKENLRIVRAQPGCATIPIHLIGGIAHKSNAGDVDSFVRAAQEGGCVGASLYEWAGTTSAEWEKLRAIAW